MGQGAGGCEENDGPSAVWVGPNFIFNQQLVNNLGHGFAIPARFNGQTFAIAKKAVEVAVKQERFALDSSEDIHNRYALHPAGIGQRGSSLVEWKPVPVFPGDEW